MIPYRNFASYNERIVSLSYQCNEQQNYQFSSNVYVQGTKKIINYLFQNIVWKNQNINISYNIIGTKNGIDQYKYL